MAELAHKLLSFEDYLIYDDQTDNRYELINGKLTLIPPPILNQILIAKFLQENLTEEIKRLQYHWFCLQSVGIRTGLSKSRLPDLTIVTQAQVEQIRHQVAVFQISPLLVIEVVSPSSIKQDYRFKRSEYAGLEIPEYWIVDPLENKMSVLILEEGFYEITEFTGLQKIRSPTFNALDITPEQIFSAF